jgi:hypothetical protein
MNISFDLPPVSKEEPRAPE